MNLRRCRLLLARDLGEILRDRRALAAALFLPLLLYPLLFLLLGRIDAPGGREMPAEPATIYLAPEMQGLKETVRAEGLQPERLLVDPRLAVREFLVDAALLPGKEKGEALLLVQAGRADPVRVQAAVERALFARQEAWLHRAGAAPRLRLVEGGKGPEEGGGALPYLPLILVLVLISGTAFAALDLLPGQKERGCLETLFVQPVRGGEVAAAKLGAVFLVGVIILVLNLGGLGAAAAWSGATPLPGWGGALALLLLGLPLALVATATVTWVCALAHSFREGQNYLLPLTLACLIPAAMGVSPAVPLNAGTALIPFTGNVLVIREALAGRLQAAPLLAMLGGTLLWAGLAAGQAARRLLGEEGRLGGRPGQALDSPHAPPGPRAAFWGVIILFTCLVLSPWLQGADLLGGTVLSLVGLILVPALLLRRLLALPLDLAFPRRRPGMRGMAGTVMAAAGTLLLALGWLRLQESFLPLPAVLEEGMGALLRGRPTWQLLLFLALLPALCEETLFRGVLLGSFRATWGGGRALLLSALLFAAFHLSVHRFLPIFAAGLVFGAILLRTRNLFLPMLCHFLYNGLLCTRDLWGGLLPPGAAAELLEGREALPALACAVAGAVLALAGILVAARGAAMRGGLAGAGGSGR